MSGSFVNALLAKATSPLWSSRYRKAGELSAVRTVPFNGAGNGNAAIVPAERPAALLEGVTHILLRQEVAEELDGGPLQELTERLGTLVRKNPGSVLVLSGTEEGVRRLHQRLALAGIPEGSLKDDDRGGGLFRSLVSWQNQRLPAKFLCVEKPVRLARACWLGETLGLEPFFLPSESGGAAGLAAEARRIRELQEEREAFAMDFLQRMFHI